MRRYKALIILRGGRVSLLDVDVLARRKGAIQVTDSIRHLLDTICPPPGRDGPAGVVLIPADAECGVGPAQVANLAARLMRRGAARKKRRASRVRRAGETNETSAAKNANAVLARPVPVEPQPTAPVPFKGGEMTLCTDRVELCGVPILGDTGTGQCRAILDVLKCRRSDGRYVHVGGEKLAEAIGAEGGIGTVTGCIRRIRVNATTRLREQLGLVVGLEDVIANDRRYGYCLKEWITVVEAADTVTGAPTGSDEPVTKPANEPVNETVHAPVDDAVTSRRVQILAALASGGRLRAPAIAEKVGSSLATAKRDLAALKRAGKLTFDGPPKSGRYRLEG